jgi:hypothetical protein
MTITAAQIAQFIGGTVDGDPNTAVSNNSNPKMMMSFIISTKAKQPFDAYTSKGYFS